MKRLRLWLSALALPLACTACITGEMPAADVCDEVGYAISSRAFGCTGDAKQATTVYDDFMAAYQCQVTDYQGDEFGKTLALKSGATVSVEEAYQCPGNLRALACSMAAVDDYAKLLANGGTSCGLLMLPQ